MYQQCERATAQLMAGWCRMRSQIYCAVAALLCAGHLAIPYAAEPCQGQELEFVKDLRLKGTITSIDSGKIVLTDEIGSEKSLKIQDGDQYLSLEGGTLIVNGPARINVQGQVPADTIPVGATLKFNVQIDRTGKVTEAVEQFELLPIDSALQLTQTAEPEDRRDAFPAEVVGIVLSAKPRKLVVQIAPNEYVGKTELTIPLAESSQVVVADDDLGFVQDADQVTDCFARQTKGGDLVVFSIEIELAPREQLVSRSLDERLQWRFAHFSSVSPSAPRKLNSDHFLLHTDISDREGKILLAKLETMLELVSNYYSVKPRQIIECYVVEELRRWPANFFDEDTIAKISAGEGYTSTRSQGSRRKSLVYSAANHSIVQHESVHAFCGQNFKTTGPFWYSEGMAELGLHWKPGERAVSTHPAVVDYLRKADRFRLEDILVDERILREGWHDYAWRWSVCHLLANNPNYARDFSRIGHNLMNQSGASFGEVFGDRVNYIKFEYQHFMDLLQNGLRADLIAWNWDVKAKKLNGSRKSTREIVAAGGWQVTPVWLEPDKNYSIQASGEWRLSSGGTTLGPDGLEDGQGKLVGAIFKDFQLSEPFEIGSELEFMPPSEGQLVLRCRDHWGELGDNQGQIKVQISRPK